MRNVSDKSFTENQITHFVFSKTFFFENSAFYEKAWENMVERGRPHIILTPDEFLRNLVFADFAKICQENSSFLKI